MYIICILEKGSYVTESLTELPHTNNIMEVL